MGGTLLGNSLMEGNARAKSDKAFYDNSIDTSNVCSIDSSFRNKIASIYGNGNRYSKFEQLLTDDQQRISQCEKYVTCLQKNGGKHRYGEAERMMFEKPTDVKEEQAKTVVKNVVGLFSSKIFSFKTPKMAPLPQQTMPPIENAIRKCDFILNIS